MLSSCLRLAKILCTDPNYFFSALLKRLRVRFPIDYYLFKNGRAWRPIILEIEATHLCNLHCYMCDLYGGQPIDAIRSQRYKEQELMNLGEFKSLIDDALRFRPTISFCGGEPLLAKDIIPMISYVKSKGLVASLVTNGTLLKERAEELVSLGIDNIVVSIDGPADIHDAIRGHPGTFGRASSGMTAVAGVKKKQGKTKPRMRVNCTITGKNYNYISQVVEIAKSLGADSLVYSHLWFWDKAIVERHNASFSHLVKTTPQNARALEGIDVETLSREVNEVRLKTKEFPIQFLPDLNPEQIKVFYQNTTQFLKTRCLYPWLVTMIMPNGDLIPCLDYPLGNVRKEKFTNVWNNQRYRQFRIALKKEGVFPGCARCCGLFSF